MPSDKTLIPLCHSEFLQGLTILLGRRSLKSLRHSNPILKFEREMDHANGAEKERLNIEASNWTGRLTKIAIWEDSIGWMYFREAQSGRRAVAFETHADLTGMVAEQIAELVRSTLDDPASTKEFWMTRRMSQDDH